MKKEKLTYGDVLKAIITHQFNNARGWGEVWTVDLLADYLANTAKQKEKIKEYCEKVKYDEKTDSYIMARRICRILNIKI